MTPKTTQNKKRCAYCGEPATTDDHVVSRALFGPSKDKSRVQRITVPACRTCNASWEADEPHFRNVLAISGEPNAVVSELWGGKIRRSFAYVDGQSRLWDLAALLVPIQTAQGERHLVYPGRDERVMRIVRKVIRGLCHHHGIQSEVTDRQVWADVMTFEVPKTFLDEMTSAHSETDILSYRYAVLKDEIMNSSWLLTFYERTQFVGIVFTSEEARTAAERSAEVERTLGGLAPQWRAITRSGSS